jgi:hypothetical protein
MKIEDIDRAIEMRDFIKAANERRDRFKLVTNYSKDGRQQIALQYSGSVATIPYNLISERTWDSIEKLLGAEIDGIIKDYEDGIAAL